jgi:hypothetical protein
MENSSQQNPKDSATGVEVVDRLTSLPLLHSWRSDYVFVAGAFVVWVVLLIALQRMFS